MASVKSGSFTGSGSTGNQAVTGVGFQPEFLIIIGVATANESAAADGRLIIGMASGASDQQALDFRDDGGQGSTNTAKSQQSGKIISAVATATDTIAAEAALVSFDVDGFTINWSVANAALYQYLAISGADFQAKVGSFDMNGSIGNQAVTGVGFQPKAVMFFGTIEDTTEGAIAGAKLSVGCATDTSEQWAFSAVSRDNLATSVAKEYITTSKCITRIHSAGGIDSVTLGAELVSLDSDGFTIDITTALACRMIYVAFAGSLDFHAGTVAQPTTTSTVAESGVGHEPQCVMFAGVGGSSLDTILADCFPVIGWSDSSLTEGFACASVDDNAGTSSSFRDSGAGFCVERMSPGSPATVVTQASMNSLDSDGFTLNWTLVDATASIIGYLSIGDTDEGGGEDESGVASKRAFPSHSIDRLFPNVSSRAEPVV